MKVSDFRFIVLSVLLFFTACSSKAELPRQDLGIGKAVFHCELALTPETRRDGLMFRETLADDAGMLFVFPDEAPRNFWMKNTSLPLSIAYISRQGVIKSILDMTPFSLDSVPSQHSVSYALEVKQGTFSRLGIQVGDTIKAEDLAKIPAVQN